MLHPTERIVVCCKLRSMRITVKNSFRAENRNNAVSMFFTKWSTVSVVENATGKVPYSQRNREWDTVLFGNLQPCNRELSVMPQMQLPYRRPTVFQCIFCWIFSSSANIQQWALPFTAGVSWLSRPDQLTRLQTTSTWDGLQQTECSNREVYVERTNICRHQFVQRWGWNLSDRCGVFVS